MSGQRKARVASSMRASLAEQVRALSDPRIKAAGMISINHIELNRDMSIANIYVSLIGAEEQHLATAVEALGQASGRMRGPLGRALNLKRCPELRFFADHSLEFRERLAEILHDDETRDKTERDENVDERGSENPTESDAE